MHVYLFCPGDLVTRSGDWEIRSIYMGDFVRPNIKYP